MIGWVFYKKQSLLEKIMPLWPYLSVSSIVCSVLFMRSLEPSISFEQAIALMGQAPPLTSSHIVAVASCAILAWHLTFLSLIFAYRLMNWKNAALRYITDSSYWVYIIHIPLVFYFQAYFHTQDLPIIVEFLAISTATLAIGFASYSLLVRRSPIGWLLNGRKNKKGASS